MATRPQTDSPHRPAWTDERLDDLAHSMREGFVRVDDRFAQVDSRFNQMEGRFDHLDARIDNLQRTLVIGLFGLTGTLLAAIVAALTAVLTLS